MQVCGREDVKNISAIVVTSDCNRDSCTKGVAVLINANSQGSNLKILKSVDTSEFYGADGLIKLEQWSSNTATFRINGLFPDSGCTPEIIKNTYANKLVTVNLKTGAETLDETCYLKACGSQDLVCIK